MTTASELVLYRFFDGEGRLLYIGKSINVWNRFANHRRDGKFYPDAAQVTLTRGFSNEAELLEAEAAAIKSEKPIHNIAHNRPPKAPKGPRLPDPELPSVRGLDVAKYGWEMICSDLIVGRTPDELIDLAVRLEQKAPEGHRRTDAEVISDGVWYPVHRMMQTRALLLSDLFREYAAAYLPEGVTIAAR
ncbi:hypothetical protein [uncultured Gordonia sp.]|uniref:hypothetical protein n=1 Tax=uncultured Gordonia sp. TaxID=198437 RepID=UPI002616B1CD|nr:hypothetical protein [uncultured Gordonia sp.]